MSQSLLPSPLCSWTHTFYYWRQHYIKFFDRMDKLLSGWWPPAILTEQHFWAGVATAPPANCFNAPLGGQLLGDDLSTMTWIHVMGLFSHLLYCTSVLFADMMLYEILRIWVKCFINPLWWCLPRPYTQGREARTQLTCLLLSSWITSSMQSTYCQLASSILKRNVLWCGLSFGLCCRQVRHRTVAVVTWPL